MKSKQEIPSTPEKLAEATKAYEDLIEIYPDNEDYLLYYAELLLASHKQATALEALQRLHAILKAKAPTKARQLAANYPQLGEVCSSLSDENNDEQLYLALYKAFGSLWIRLHQRTIREGETLYQQNEKGDSLSLIIKGELAVYIHNEEDNKHTLLNLIKEHDIVGEACFLTPSMRTANIVANCKSTIVELPRQKLMSYLVHNPNIQELLEKTDAFRHMLRLISNNPILKKIPLNLRQFMAKKATILSYPANSMIHQAGDIFHGIDMIIKGKAHYISTTRSGKKITIESMTCGALIGDASAIRHATSPADLMSLEALTMAHIPNHTFTTVVAAYPPLKESLIRHSELQRDSIIQAIRNQLGTSNT